MPSKQRVAGSNPAGRADLRKHFIVKLSSSITAFLHGPPGFVPVVVAEYEGGRYLVSMLGKDANWVLNVRVT